MKKNIYAIIVFAMALQVFTSCDNTKKDGTQKDDTKKTEEVASKAADKPSIEVSSEEKIVYVNSDSVLIQYDYYKSVNEGLKSKALSYDQQIQSKAKAFENQVMAAQKAAATMDVNTAKAKEQQLVAAKEQLYKFDESLKTQLANEEQDLHIKISDTMKDFMKRYAEEKGYKMVMGYKQGLTLWYADEGMDVTEDVIKKLNEEYNAKSESK